MNDEEKLESIRNEVYNLFKGGTDEKEFLYVSRDWIFPNHIDVMIEISNELCDKYGGDKYICELGILLHDVGLVYKRDSPSPIGHEFRSLEYANTMLNKYDFSNDIIEEVCECIRSTEKKHVPKTVNGKIVITSDVMAHMTSVHYFAKSLFYGDWQSYLNWIKPRMGRVLERIQFDDEREKIRPIRDYILNAIEMHERLMKKYLRQID